MLSQNQSFLIFLNLYSHFIKNAKPIYKPIQTPTFSLFELQCGMSGFNLYVLKCLSQALCGIPAQRFPNKRPLQKIIANEFQTPTNLSTFFR